MREGRFVRAGRQNAPIVQRLNQGTELCTPRSSISSYHWLLGYHYVMLPIHTAKLNPTLNRLSAESQSTSPTDAHKRVILATAFARNPISEIPGSEHSLISKPAAFPAVCSSLDFHGGLRRFVFWLFRKNGKARKTDARCFWSKIA